MTVIAFTQKDASPDGAWRAPELHYIVGSFAAELTSGEAGGWATGTTDAGDPQFYLLGPPPDDACILCVSRLGRLYVLEDGNGRLLLEDTSFEFLAQQAKAHLRQSKASLFAQIALAWGALRQAFEEKIEPVMAEGEEFLMHFAPQLAVFA